MESSLATQLWLAQINGVIVILVRITAVLFTAGFAWNATRIILHAGIEGGGSRIIPEVGFRVAGMVIGLMLAISAPSIVNDLAEILMSSKVFGL
jgi:hypothetical protein